MSQAHPTTIPEQMQSNTWIVFGNTEPSWTDTTNKTFIDAVEVPRYSQPNSDGVELSRDKRLALAVYRAVKYGDNGETYWVLAEVGGDFEPVEYEENPSFDGVWDPETEEVENNGELTVLHNEDMGTDIVDVCLEYDNGDIHDIVNIAMDDESIVVHVHDPKDVPNGLIDRFDIDMEGGL